jgi:Tfp pilus assembly PilM family ATPase
LLRRRSELTPIGLDIGERCVRAVQLRRDPRSDNVELVAAARLRSPAGAGELTIPQAADVLDALDRQGFIGGRVVVGLPQRCVLSGVLEVPPRSSGAPLDVICRNELARAHRLESEQIESAWWELPPGPVPSREIEGAQAAVVGCRQSDAESIMTALEGGGAEVLAIETRGPALVRAACRAMPPAPALGAVIEWDAEAALIVVQRAGTILYERHLVEVGLSSCRNDLIRKLAIDSDVAEHLLEQIGLGETPPEFAEESELVDQARRLLGERIDSLAMEFRASAAYASRRFGDSVSAVLICGDGVSIPMAVERLERRIEQPLALASPQLLFPGVEIPEHVLQPTSLATAIGLAGHPTGGGA